MNLSTYQAALTMTPLRFPGHVLGGNSSPIHAHQIKLEQFKVGSSDMDIYIGDLPLLVHKDKALLCGKRPNYPRSKIRYNPDTRISMVSVINAAT